MSKIEKPPFEITIEDLNETEIDELADVAARSFADAFGEGLTPDELDTIIAESRSADYFKQSMNTSRILVAKEGGVIVGYIQYGEVKIPEVDSSSEDQEIGRVYVDTDKQGIGIGKKMLQKALDDPMVNKAPNVYLQVWGKNAKAIKLYESFGFIECGVTTFMQGGKTMQDQIMVKRQRDY